MCEWCEHTHVIYTSSLVSYNESVYVYILSYVAILGTYMHIVQKWILTYTGTIVGNLNEDITAYTELHYQ